ncbi:putative nwd2 protein [Mycena sanguinolenta]|uniref:Putative nwd2 protein n=1 Tax=Mycena sanguinolenta TaxID=230812 RepID=A0A8H6YF82_9AGAR|nr:putative nwd2 protein [Mycena sanguinolenta]
MNNYLGGGTGGPGGNGHGNSTGGGGGHGLGASVIVDIRTQRFEMNNIVHFDNRDFQTEHSVEDTATRDALPHSRSAPLQQDIDYRGQTGIDILLRVIALTAIYDSAESFPQPKCHPDTRRQMLQDLREWALDRSGPNVLWLFGPAGAGKSAIMQTLCSELEAAGRLGGSFFFKRGHATRGNGKALFATLAYQLALNVSWLRTPISQIVERDPSITVRSIEKQMQKLICEHRRPAENDNSVIVVVDGLDECEGQGIQEEILRAIGKCCSDSSIPLRFIVASRPEPHIREVFDSRCYRTGYEPMDVEKSFTDVRKYLVDEFSRIYREHCDTMKSIQSPWPVPDVLEELVRKSSGHFIYASTIIKFIDDKNYRPTERLAVVLDGSGAGSEAAFDALDQLYLTILRSTPRQPSQLVPVLCAIANFDLPARTIDRALGLADGDTRLVLRGLHSVLRMESDLLPIYWHHASFLDFLNNPNRSHNFYVGGLNTRLDLAHSCLKLYAGPYQAQNIKFSCLGSQTPRHQLIPFILSLPCSPELCSLVRLMNPEYIFELDSDLNLILSWLKPSAPPDLIKLWEEYIYMSSFEKMVNRGKFRCSPNTVSLCSIQPRDSDTPELLRILVAMLLTTLTSTSLRDVRRLLDVTWSQLRATICNLRPAAPQDETTSTSAIHSLDLRSACLNLARSCIRRVSTEGLSDQFDQGALAVSIGFLVRSAAPSHELYEDLWTMPPPQRWCGSSYYAGLFIHHIAQWLSESLPGRSVQELGGVWQRSLKVRPSSSNYNSFEQDWTSCQQRWNNTIANLGLPDHLKISM